MVLRDLIEMIQAKHRELPPEVVRAVVKRIFEEISSTLEDGGRVELRGFGVFEATDLKAGKARNPKTGEAIAVPDRKRIHFKAGKALHGALNRSPRSTADG